MTVVSARIALRDPACVVKLADWLLAEIAQKFAVPETTGEKIGQRYLNVSMTEWRLMVRRLVRCGLAVGVPAKCVPAEFVWRNLRQ